MSSRAAAPDPLAGLTKAQKAGVEQVKDFTSCSDAQAVAVLKQVAWNVQLAADRFFNSGMVPDKPAAAAAFAPPASAGKKAGKAEAEFKRLVGASERLGLEEVEALCEELGIDGAADPAILVVLYATGVKSLADGGVTREQFVQGMVNLDCDSVAALKGKLEAQRAKLQAGGAQGDAFFGPFWTWAYVFNCAEGQKSLTLDVARGLTKMLLRPERFPLVAEWVAFLEQAGAKTAVSKDTWALLLDFGRKVRPDLSNYDAEGGAWPSVIDDFCEWLISKRRAGGGSGGGGGGAGR